MTGMREPYFTAETIDGTTESLLAGIAFRRPPADFHPETAALLVLDMQRCFLSPDSHAFVPSAPAVLPGIRRMVKSFLDARRPVYFTRHLNTLENAAMMGSWWRRLIREEDPESEIVPELARFAVPVIVKSQYDAFYDTPLLRRLRDGGVGQVVITGVMTNLCCETTARSAFVRGLQVFFPVDGTAAYNRELHRASLLNLAHGFAFPTTMETLAGEFKG